MPTVIPFLIRPSFKCLLICAVAANLFAAAGCGKEQAYQPPPPPSVTMARPLQTTIQLHRDFTGRAEAYATVELRPRVVGYLQEMHFEEGREVQEGDLLFTIDPAPYQATVEAAKADVDRAKATLEKADYERDRLSKLIERNAASEVERFNAEADRNRASAELLAARAALSAAELDLEYTQIKAPLTGRISKTSVDPGNLVGRNDSTLLATITQWHPLHVNFTVDERTAIEYRRRVAEGATTPDVAVQFIMADGTLFPETGTIDYIDNQANAETGTVAVRAIVDNPRGLMLPGMFTRVRIKRPPVEAMLVPESALQRDLAGYFLMGADENGLVDRIRVEAGEQVGRMREIVSGLDADQRFVVKGVQRARPGIKVTIEEMTLTPNLAAPESATTAPAATRSTRLPDDEEV